MAFEQHENAAARRIAQNGQIVEDGGFHPYIRINCYTKTRPRQGPDSRPRPLCENPWLRGGSSLFRYFRSTLPGNEALNFPSSITTTPFTITRDMPSASGCGSV